MYPTLHHYRSRQLHRISIENNTFTDGRSESFFAHGHAHMGRMGKWLWRCTSTGQDKPIELRKKSVQRFQRKKSPTGTQRGEWENDWLCKTIRLDNSIGIWTQKIPPTVSDICVPQRLGRTGADFTRLWPMGKSLWGKRANYPDVA